MNSSVLSVAPGDVLTLDDLATNQAELPNWFKREHKKFKKKVLNKKYPCHFGTIAEAQGQLRYLFVESEDIEAFGDGLREFIQLSRSNPETRHALTVFFKPCDQPQELSYYESQFWRVLAQLIEIERIPWPTDRPEKPEDPEWEFCFDGEPMFVFSANPGYEARDTRVFGKSHLMLFQPRRIFDGIEGGTFAGTRAREQIRKRMEKWEGMPTHPDMGSYGDPSSQEWKQYFLPDDNTRLPAICPISKHKTAERIAFPNEPTIKRDKSIDMHSAVMQLLPETGSVEVQRDTPGRKHPTHMHPTHETLLIIDGEIEFRFGDQNEVCQSGDRLFLPVGIRHTSTAGPNGCIYVIGLHQ